MLSKKRKTNSVSILFLASEELSIGNVRFTTFDLGGHSQGTLTALTIVAKLEIQIFDLRYFVILIHWMVEYL